MPALRSSIRQPPDGLRMLQNSLVAVFSPAQALNFADRLSGVKLKSSHFLQSLLRSPGWALGF